MLPSMSREPPPLPRAPGSQVPPWHGSPEAHCPPPACAQPRTPGKGPCTHVPISILSAQLYSATRKETQIKCQLIVSTEEVLN